MITRITSNPKRRTTWYRRFLPIGIVRVEQPNSATRRLSLVICRMMERRYSATNEGFIWREPK